MRILLASLISLLPGFAMAEECGKWTAEMQEDEGGPVMTASVCAKAGSGRSDIRVQCGGEGSLALRFDPASSFQPSDPEYKTPLIFSLDGKAETRKAHYEEMDGALVVVLGVGDTLAGDMSKAGSLTISAPGNPFNAAEFSLAGSSKALQKLEKSCK